MAFLVGEREIMALELERFRGFIDDWFSMSDLAPLFVNGQKVPRKYLDFMYSTDTFTFVRVKSRSDPYGFPLGECTIVGTQLRREMERIANGR